MTSSHVGGAQTASLATSFARVLHADGPDPERKENLALFSWFIGDWEMEVSAILQRSLRTPTGRLGEKFCIAFIRGSGAMSASTR
jgi:hypothetical protein